MCECTITIANLKLNHGWRQEGGLVHDRKGLAMIAE